MQLCLNKSDIPAHLLKYFKPKHVLKQKDDAGIPWAVAFALRADGWYLRQDIVWNKPNPMPESVTDRCTRAHEYIFLLTKKQKYFYDAEAVKERAIEGKDLGLLRGKSFVDSKNVSWHATSILKRQKEGINSRTAGTGYRNKRTVWTVSTQPYPEAHFATFPPKLIEPCILAGTSPKACEICGSPWERVVERNGMTSREWQKIRGDGTKGFDKKMGKQGKSIAGGRPPDPVYKTLGWQPTCTCKNSGKGRCIVLDPFAGSGTTLWVAEQHGRDSIGIELNPEYCNLIRKRMDKMQQTIFSLGVSE
jgi:DNA modification methylase